MATYWNWHDDRQWSSSRITKSGDTSKWFEMKTGRVSPMKWALEVRSEYNGVGSVRLGEMLLSGSPTGELTISIREEPDAIR